MNISLPENMRSWVDEQVNQGGYGTASEYFRQLIREEQKRQLKRRIDDKLLAALDSGDPIEITPEYWDRKLQRLAKPDGDKDNRTE